FNMGVASFFYCFQFQSKTRHLCGLFCSFDCGFQLVRSINRIVYHYFRLCHLAYPFDMLPWRSCRCTDSLIQLSTNKVALGEWNPLPYKAISLFCSTTLSSFV